jgi:hypothetical protein
MQFPFLAVRRILVTRVLPAQVEFSLGTKSSFRVRGQVALPSPTVNFAHDLRSRGDGEWRDPPQLV